MQTLVIKRENGNISKTLDGQDHTSGLLFLVASAKDIPEEFASSPFVACSSSKTAQELGLTADNTYGYRCIGQNAG